MLKVWGGGEKEKGREMRGVRKMEIDRAGKLPIFTSEAIDSLRLTDYMFLTPGPADIILSLVAVSDFSLSSTLLQIRWEKNITLGEPPGFLHSWWWWVSQKASFVLFLTQSVWSCFLSAFWRVNRFYRTCLKLRTLLLLPAHTHTLTDMALVSIPSLHNSSPSSAQTVASFERSWTLLVKEP